MLVVDAAGTPIGFRLASAQVAEVVLAPGTLDTVRVSREAGRPGRPRQRPAQVVADRGYASRALRAWLHRHRMALCVPPTTRQSHWRARRGRPPAFDQDAYARRWVVERTFAWLGNFRRLLVRHERLLQVYRGFFTLALILITLARVLE
jgi:transposase